MLLMLSTASSSELTMPCASSGRCRDRLASVMSSTICTVTGVLRNAEGFASAVSFVRTSCDAQRSSSTPG